MIDTLRLAITWACNYRCSYCCNNAPLNYRDRFRPVRLHEIDWSRYKTVCITGGEPFLVNLISIARLRAIIPQGIQVVIYSNFSGSLFPYTQRQLRPVNYTLSYHPEHSGPLDNFLFRALIVAREPDVKVRINIPGPPQPAYAEAYPELEFKFYEPDGCLNDNEEFLYLTELP